MNNKCKIGQKIPIGVAAKPPNGVFFALLYGGSHNQLFSQQCYIYFVYILVY